MFSNQKQELEPNWSLFRGTGIHNAWVEILLNDQILSALSWRFLLQAKTFSFSRVRICYFLAFPEFIERTTFFYLRVWRRLQDCLIGLIARFMVFSVLLAFLTFRSQLFQGRPCRIVYSQHVGCRNVYSHNIYLLTLQKHIFFYSYKFVYYLLNSFDLDKNGPNFS